MSVKPIPDGYTSVTPYLIVKGAAKAIEFYKAAFGAEEIMRFAGPGDQVGHAELRVGSAIFMLADEFPDMKAQSPTFYGGTPVSFCLYVPDVDHAAARAVAAGARELRPVKDQFYGDRAGTFEDPFGHVWTLATHKEDVSMDEMRRRHEELMQQSK